MGGAANTSPGQAASSMPLPTIITCAGSWPDPEPWITDTLSSRGASVRMIKLYSGTYLSVSGLARAWSISGTKSLGLLTNFFTATSVGYDWCRLRLGGQDSAGLIGSGSGGRPATAANMTATATAPASRVPMLRSPV